MGESKRHIILYYDAECTKMLPMEVVDNTPSWILDFGRLDAGTSKTESFFIKNTGGYLIEQLEVTLGTISSEGVTAHLVTSPKVATLKPNTKTKVTVEWVAASEAQAAICKGPLTIKAFVMREEFRQEEV